MYDKMGKGLLKCWTYWADVLCIAVLLVLLWVPDIHQVTALSFLQDKFFHIDFFAASAGLAYTYGKMPSVDINANYGGIIPIIFADICRWMGGFSYDHLFRVIVMGGIAYFIGYYIFLRAWLKNVPLAIFGLVVAVHMQMFHIGIAPLIWRFPSTTELRYFLDVPFFYFLCRHAEHKDSRSLHMAALICGLMLATVFEVGVYLTMALYFYCAALLVVPQASVMRQNIKSLISAALLPPLIWMAVMLIFFKGHVFQATFWANNTEFSRLFLAGFGAMPMIQNLNEGHALAFFGGFALPAMYLLTLMIIGSLCFLGIIRWQHLPVLAICVYGLGTYHYYVYRSAVTSYCVVAVPFVLICCFWLKHILERFFVTARIQILWCLAGVSVVALLMNPLFRNYPNVFNTFSDESRNNLIKYQQQTDITADVQLIRSITSEKEAVPLISSLETKILMDARRAPFFYYTPLVYPRTFEGLDFGGTDILTKSRMQKILSQVQTQAPEHVFVEKKLFLGYLPGVYYGHYETLTILMKYLSEYYVPLAEGKYLLALKRKL